MGLRIQLTNGDNHIVEGRPQEGNLGGAAWRGPATQYRYLFVSGLFFTNHFSNIFQLCFFEKIKQISHQPANQQLFYGNSDTIWYHATMHFFPHAFACSAVVLGAGCLRGWECSFPMRGCMVYGGGIHRPVTKQTNNTKKNDIVLINQDISHQGNRLKKKIPKIWGSKMSIFAGYRISLQLE